MASTGNISLYEGIPKLKDAFIIIVKTEWNADIVNKLEASAKKIFRSQGIRCKTIVVPGAVEIPFAVSAYARSGEKSADAYITFGAVIRGDTPHFEYVCNTVVNGITSLNLSLTAPVIFGVLTVNDELQAKERTGGKHGNKGEEAAIAAIKMISLNRSLAPKK